jgi:hypothetical protein
MQHNSIFCSRKTAYPSIKHGNPHSFRSTIILRAYITLSIPVQFHRRFRGTYYIKNYWVSGLCPSSGILIIRKHKVSEIGSVSFFRWREGDTYSVGFRKNLDISKRPKRAAISLPPPEDGNRSRYSSQYVVFSSYLEFRTIDEVQKPSNSECYTPSSEPLRLYYLHHQSFKSRPSK